MCWIERIYTELLEEYKEIKKSGDVYWVDVEREIRFFAKGQESNFKIYGHH